MFNGLEVDVLSLGDADCIVVTHWTHFGPQRILVDGGTEDDAEVVFEFLRRRKFTDFWAVICSHQHRDHARGLIKLIQNKQLTYQNCWMHDIRQHFSRDALRRAMAGNSSEADALREIVETTGELARAFADRKLVSQEPFAGVTIASYPPMVALGPSLEFYNRVVRELVDVDAPRTVQPSFLAALAAAGTSQAPSPLFASASVFSPPARPYTTLSSLLAPPVPRPVYGSLLPALAGTLSKSSLKDNPVTQPFNNTSTILGILLEGNRFLFTADAGTRALERVPLEWKNLKWMQVPHHGSEGNLSPDLIERFRPEFANISASGDSSHPSRAVVSGLVKVGAKVFSTHQSGHLWFWIGRVPARADYLEAIPMKGTGRPAPVLNRSLGPNIFR